MVGRNILYLWATPEDYLNKAVGQYDHNISPEQFLLRRGSKLNASEFSLMPIVKFEVKKEKLLKYDCLPNNSFVPLVNNKVKILLETLAPNDVQFFEAKIICADGELRGYYFVNITAVVKGINYEASVYSKMKTVDAILGFKHAVYKEECLGAHHLARDDEYHSHLLVSETIKQAFDQEHVTGVRLIRPEEYY